ncbi:hypothetical protein RvY_00044 [Ramazzottius varieornatus]|uniref:DUF4200 domain-containing protein n=1 Tax=Ramazzottius varieornatus TaxID=947166 RepID=A0A1D1UC98_RAMVA|nr:hypothetical protein RvY_00044 [Ramazzottius varieornatus]
MKKVRKKASKTKLFSPSRMPHTLDTTVFLEKEPDKDSDSEGDYVSPDEEPKTSPLTRKFSSQKVECIRLGRCEKRPAKHTIHAIEKEIERHTAQVKQQKAVEHLTTPGSPTSKSNLDSESTSLYVPTELLIKTSSVDMAIKQFLIKPTRKPSLSQLLHVLTKRKLARKVEKEAQSVESLLKINPFKMNKELDMLELREMLNQGKRSKYANAILKITDDKARRQYQVFNDRRLLAPVFNFCKTAHMEEGKKATYANLDTREKTKPQQFFHFRDVPQLLAVTRKNRRMYRESRWDVKRRVRETNQCNISLAIKRRMIDYLNSSVQTFSKEISTVEEETEQFARAFDDFLRQNDEQTIQAIHRARQASRQRKAAAVRCRAIDMRNNLLVNHNIRSEDKIRLLDRFINLCYAVLAGDVRAANLKRAEDERKKFNQERFRGYSSAATSFGSFVEDSSVRISEAVAPIITVEAHSEDFGVTKSISESLLVHLTLSSESEAEYSSVSPNELNPVFVQEALKVPPVPFPNVTSALQTIADFRAKCLDLCTASHTFREHTKEMKAKMLDERQTAGEIQRQSSIRIRVLQEEVNALTDRLDNTESTIALYNSGLQSREEFFKPMKQLSQDIVDVYRTCMDSVDQPPTVELMLSALRKCLIDHQLKLKAYPPAYIKRWYEKVVANRVAEGRDVVLQEKQQRGEEAMADRALQGANVIPRRQLRPRSQPPDHDNEVVTAMKSQPAMLDVMVQKMEHEVSREDEAGEQVVDESVSRYFDQGPSLPTIDEEAVDQLIIESSASLSLDSLPHISSAGNFRLSSVDVSVLGEVNASLPNDIQMPEVPDTETAGEQEPVAISAVREDSIHPKLDDIFSDLDEGNNKPEDRKRSAKAALVDKVADTETVQPSDETKSGKARGPKGHGAKKSQASSKK